MINYLEFIIIRGNFSFEGSRFTSIMPNPPSLKGQIFLHSVTTSYWGIIMGITEIIVTDRFIIIFWNLMSLINGAPRSLMESILYITIRIDQMKSGPQFFMNLGK
jgi:hypothetical protein